MYYFFGKYKKFKYCFSLIKNTNLVFYSRKVTSIAPILLKSANISSLKTFQNKELIYNNIVDPILQKCQNI